MARMPAMLRAALEQTAAHGPQVAADLAPFGGNGGAGGAVGKCLTVSGAGSNDLEVENLIAFHGSQDPDASGPVTHPIPAQSNEMATCFAIQERAICENPNAGPDGAGFRSDDRAYTMEARTTAQAVAYCITGDIAHTLTANGFDASEDGTGRGTPTVAFQVSQSGERISDTHATLDANNGSRRHYGAAIPVPGRYAVRRLTPLECHRLQGFPDDHCAIDRGGKPAADGVQYKALGNSMAVPVMNWMIARASGRVPTIEGGA